MKTTLSTVLLLAGVVSAVAVADPVGAPEPIKTLKPKFGFCGVKGSSCKRDAEAAPVPAPEPIRILRPKFGFCGVKGSSCKRDAEAEADPKKKLRILRPKFGFCGVKGSSCHRMKRSAEAIAEAFAAADPTADADPIRILNPKFGFCGVKGSSCHKARRSIENVGEIVERNFESLEAREAEAEANPKKKLRILRPKFGFCGVKGSSCKMAKRDAIRILRPKFGFCGVKGSSCKRAEDAEAVTEAINAWDPTYLSEVCHEEGGECAALVNAHKAFKQIKRDTEELNEKREAEDEENTYDEELDEIEAALDEAVANLN